VEGLTEFHRYSIWHFEVNEHNADRFNLANMFPSGSFDPAYIFPLIVPQMARTHSFNIGPHWGGTPFRHVWKETYSFCLSKPTREVLDYSTEGGTASKVRITIMFEHDIAPPTDDTIFAYDLRSF
jgi:hypothetical protein